MTLRHALMGFMLPLTMVACAGNQNETGRASVDAVTDQPDDYIGRTVTVSGEVENVQQDRRVFTVEDHDWLFPENLLVVTARPTSELLPGGNQNALSEDRIVRVTGTIQRLITAELERELDLDLERDFEMEFQERPILVANSLQLIGDRDRQNMNTGQEQMNTEETGMNPSDTGMTGDTTHPGATVPPPADSALLERDLPNVPPGDTIQDMKADSIETSAD